MLTLAVMLLVLALTLFVLFCMAFRDEATPPACIFAGLATLLLILSSMMMYHAGHGYAASQSYLERGHTYTLLSNAGNGYYVLAENPYGEPMLYELRGFNPNGNKTFVARLNGDDRMELVPIK